MIPSAHSSAKTVGFSWIDHRDPVEAVRDLRRDQIELEAAELLEVGELRDLHPVAPHLPAEPPGTDGRLLPVVLDEPDVVLVGVEPDRAQRLEVELEHIAGCGFRTTWYWK